MFFAEFAWALAFGLLIGVIFYALVGRSGPWDGFVWFFVLLILGTWAVGAWIEPVGPVWWGVAWLPFLVAAVFIALLIAAVTPDVYTRRHRELRRPSGDETPADSATPDAQTVAATAVGIFFWGVLLVLLGAIAADYAF